MGEVNKRPQVIHDLVELATYIAEGRTLAQCFTELKDGIILIGYASAAN